MSRSTGKNADLNEVANVLWFMLIVIFCTIIITACVVSVRNGAGKECYRMRNTYPSLNFRVDLFSCQVETDDGWFSAERILDEAKGYD